MKTNIFHWVAAATLVLLTACGGGNVSSNPISGS